MTERLAESRTSKSIIGMPLYSIREGLALGLIRQVLLDGKNRCVQGFLVEKRRFSREDRILPFSAVSSFGQDGLMVERQSQLERRGQSQQFLRALRSPLPIIGARVFTAGGKNLGRVEEFHFSTADGHISGLEIAEDGFFRVRSLVDGSYIIAISTGTIMLKDQAIETAQPLEKSFMSGMENAAAVVLEKAADLKSNASQAGRRFSANFNEAMSRLKLREEEVEEAEEEAARTAQSVEEEGKELPEEKKE